MPYDFEADALLLRAVLGTAAHDLGGVASALALRADVLAASLAPDDVAALRGVVDHLRAVGRQLRRLRGTSGASSFVPSREKSLAEWCALLDRFGGPLLGRGIELKTSCSEGVMPSEADDALTYAMLALFQSLREARERANASGVVVQVRTEVESDRLVVTLRTEWGSSSSDASLAGLPSDRWTAHARALVSNSSLSWEEREGGEVRISGPA